MNLYVITNAKTREVASSGRRLREGTRKQFTRLHFAKLIP